jgi:glycosyltransferase involved in cell wall biosynthesis
MKLAIVFDDLIQYGGAERLLLDVCEIWPDAPVYTSVISREWKNRLKDKGVKYKHSFLQYLPFSAKLNRFYSVFFFHVFAFESFDLSKYDVVLSISARYAHHIITKPTTCHICYMNSPARMFWNPFSYFEGEKSKKLAKILVGSLSLLRIYDLIASKRVDYFISNSVNVQKRVQKAYGRTSAVINPCVSNLPLEQQLNTEDKGYFLIISRLISWKKIDIAIIACNLLKKRLIIVGDGPDQKRLKKLSTEYITFVGYAGEEEKKKLLLNCSALINTQEEDFGIVPLEAMSYGKPVIAYAGGGALETVVAGKSGEFFYEQTPETLGEVIKSFKAENYSAIDCRIRALAFDKSIFQHKMKDIVEKLCI